MSQEGKMSVKLQRFVSTLRIIRNFIFWALLIVAAYAWVHIVSTSWKSFLLTLEPLHLPDMRLIVLRLELYTLLVLCSFLAAIVASILTFFIMLLYGVRSNNLSDGN